MPNHIELNPQVWMDFCHQQSSIVLPTPWHTLEPLEQLLVIKHLKPDSFMTAISVINQANLFILKIVKLFYVFVCNFQGFVKSVLGSNYVENVCSDVAGVYDESKATVPVLCFVAGNSDPAQNISHLCETKLENRNKLKCFTLGRGFVNENLFSSPFKTVKTISSNFPQDRSAYQFIRKCSEEGQWALVQNIHLFSELIDEILDRLSRDANEFNPDFRLWIVGYPSAQYSSRALQFCKQKQSCRIFNAN